WGIALWLMLTRQQISDESRALIVSGLAPQTLAPVERERRRLLDARTREHLARSLEDLVGRARTTAPAGPATEPFVYLCLVRRFEPELREIAALLRADSADAVGVARVERLLTDAGSPLYGLRENLLREELARIRFQLTVS
ncbi:MAG TPA: hypothetical protein VGF21_14210, partial [Thermoleophilaceae bacterium]